MTSLLGGAIGTRRGAVKVSMVDFATPEYDAEIVTRVVAVTFLVATEKVAEVAPAGIVTDEGTGAAAEVDHRGIVLPRRYALGGIITPR